ncbi:DUF6351 family protein [Algibacillus agarilyticus]|uniref:DUF6351 family protein n=1 Tax=Algibacillus agarilyticus TaxID=2234133 RepID=UPI000DCFBE45|nr:DUF6351 family protein [Algibacillus agarilyticus]
MRKVVRIIKVGLIATLTILLIASFMSTKPANPLRIDKVATPEPNYLLKPQTHVRVTPRPTETFSFPISIGEIGPVQSLFSGPAQYPFICMSERTGFGQPEVDNQDGYGMPVYSPDIAAENRTRADIIGYSKDCLVKTAIQYYRVTPDQEFSLFDGQLNAEDMLVRLEYGSINRFLYAMAMPINLDELGDRQAKSQWNNKLIYQFGGGAGIGFRQGKIKLYHMFQRQYDQLKLGYAIVTSSGNRTSYTYNMLLSEDIARRVKLNFISLYGEPEYTVGIGGSGGGLAQYLLAQNAPGLIDAAIPLYSYPDMVSQTLYAMDCDLLNTYYTFRAEDRDSWQDMNKRRQLDGLVTQNGDAHPSAIFQPINQVLQGLWPNYPDGNSECVNGWFGLYAFIHNPRQGWMRDYFSQDVVDQHHWNHWQDLVNIYGEDDNGFARHVWGNQGIQYGLEPLKKGEMSFDEFMDVNRKVGSWKPVEEMQPENIARIPIWDKPFWLSLWGFHNVTEVETGKSASRHATDYTATERGYRYGQIYLGVADIPILDVRHYLEDKLDMHHVSASFQSRQRIEDWQGKTSHHVIWVANADYDPVDRAFEVMDEWMQGIKAGQALDIAKPDIAQDACFDEQGGVIAIGDEVWHGEWNKQPLGACQQVYKLHKTSRIQAGGRWAGNVFDCARISIDQAIKKGIYEGVDVTSYKGQLQALFPDGVCDFEQGDQSRPKDLTPAALVGL